MYNEMKLIRIFSGITRTLISLTKTQLVLPKIITQQHFVPTL